MNTITKARIAQGDWFVFGQFDGDNLTQSPQMSQGDAEARAKELRLDGRIAAAGIVYPDGQIDAIANDGVQVYLGSTDNLDGLLQYLTVSGTPAHW